VLKQNIASAFVFTKGFFLQGSAIDGSRMRSSDTERTPIVGSFPSRIQASLEGNSPRLRRERSVERFTDCPHLPSPSKLGERAGLREIPLKRGKPC